MNHEFIKKKQQLLSDLKMVAMRHNRTYYDSIIPFVEDSSDEGLIDMYREILNQDRQSLVQSRKALKTVSQFYSLIS